MNTEQISEQAKKAAEEIWQCQSNAMECMKRRELEEVLAPHFTAATADLERQLAGARTQTREQVLSWFAWLVGGYNAAQGAHSGRLVFESDYSSDEAMARRLLDEHGKDIRRDRDTLREQFAQVNKLKDSLEAEVSSKDAHITGLDNSIQQLRADLAAVTKERDECGQKINATSNMVANIQDTLRARGFVEGNLERRVISLAQAFDSAVDRLTAARERIEGMEKAGNDVLSALNGRVHSTPALSALSRLQAALQRDTETAALAKEDKQP